MKKLTCSIVVASTLLSACSGSTPSSPTVTSPVSIGSVVIAASTNVAAGEGVEFTFDVTPSTNAATIWTIDFGDRSRTAHWGVMGVSSRVTLSHVYLAAGSYTVTARASVDSNVATGTLDVNVS